MVRNGRWAGDDPSLRAPSLRSAVVCAWVRVAQALQVAAIVPADTHETTGRVKQPIDGRIAQQPGARRVERDPTGHPVQAVEHTTMTDQRNGLAPVRRRQARHCVNTTRREIDQALAARGRETGLAAAPAAGQLRQR